MPNGSRARAAMGNAPQSHVRIIGIAPGGDGIGVSVAEADRRGGDPAETQQAAIHIPFAAPGDVWDISRGPDDADLVVPAPDRQVHACPHFTVCGGCMAQHLPDETYADWKRQRVVSALAARGIEADVAPLSRIPTASRRRTVLTAERRGPSAPVTLGYFRRASHDLFDLEHCAILVPPLRHSVPALRKLCEALLPATAQRDARLRIATLSANEGLDVAVTGSPTERSAERDAALAELARENGFVRITVDGHEIAAFAKPTLSIDGVAVPTTASAFLQAAAPAERQMIDRVREIIGRAKSVVDLFSGAGTFAIALSDKGRVTAYDSDAAALAALDVAMRSTSGRKPVATVARDLFREPLSRRELGDFDAAVIDPPRAGGEAQARALAASEVPVVAAVSCNPVTFARDAALLIDGGFALKTVQPIDQFVFTQHVELVAAFERPKKRHARNRLRR
ncbi:MAG: hypothetical protein AAFZ05_09775 [Pseudomonadota bacterium]